MDEKNMPQEPQQPEAAPAQPAADPAAQPAVEPAVQPATEPVAQPAAQPAGGFAAQPEGYAQPQQPAQPYDAQPAMPQQPAQPYGAQPQPMYGQPAQYQGSSKAMPALICGVVGLVLVLLGFVVPFSGIIGLVLSIIGIVMAAKNKKQFGKDGKATAGKVCGIIGIVAWVVSFIVGLVLGAMLIGGLASNSSLVDELEESAGLESGSSSAAPSDAESDDAAALAVVKARLDGLIAGDEAQLEVIAAMVEEDFYEQTEFHLSDIGVDAMEYVRWMTESVTYEDLDVITFGDEGSATVTLKAYDVFEFLSTFDDKAGAYVNDPAFETSAVEDDLAALGSMFRDSMTETTSELERFAFVDLEKVDGTWVIDEDSLEDDLDYLFGLA